MEEQEKSQNRQSGEEDQGVQEALSQEELLLENKEETTELSGEIDETYKEITNDMQKQARRPRPFAQFVIGLLIISLVGGGALGASFALVSPYALAYFKGNEPEKVSSKLLQESDEKIERIYLDMVRAIEDDPSIKTIAKQVGPAVVSIYNNKKVSLDEYYAYFYGESEEMVTGFGSGIIFNEDEDKFYIVTNSHVVDGADSLAVNFLGDIKAEAKLVGQDSLNDIAVLYVEKNRLANEELSHIKIAVLGDSDLVEVGQLAVAIGTPMEAALNNTVTSGIISGLEREVQLSDKKMTLLQTDAAINPGNSGGALVGPNGEVIGINVAKATTGEGIGFAIPINTVKPIISELIKNGSIIRPGLGITGIAIADLESELYELPIGVYVKSVIKGGSADLAGMQEGDIITQFDGTTITTMEQLKALISEKRIGGQVEIKVIREGSKKILRVELREMPSTIPNNR